MKLRVGKHELAKILNKLIKRLDACGIKYARDLEDNKETKDIFPFD